MDKTITSDSSEVYKIVMYLIGYQTSFKNDKRKSSEYKRGINQQKINVHIKKS